MNTEYGKKRVVVSGLGAVSPLGNSLLDSWTALLAGRSGAALITKFNTEGFKTKFACELKSYSPPDFLDVKECRKLDPVCLYSLSAASEALKDAGIDKESVNMERAGVIWASGIGGLSTIDEQLFEYAAQRGRPRFSPFFIPGIISNMGAGMISIKFGLKGLNFGMVSACASSANAIADALTYIRAGKADIIIAGGAEACVCESGVGGFNAMKALSTRNESPETASRPFDAERDGFVIGEGAAALVLESLEHALARNAHIYAELAGTGLSADAYHMTATHPDGEGAFRAMKEALADASMSKEEIDYVNAHATSTSHGDLSEMRALSSLFGELEKRPHISATKSMTGHLLGAAGALEAAICVKSIETSMIPPTINTKNIDTELPGGFDLTLDSAASKKIRAAMSNSFGFGGHNATLIFKEYQKEL